ncbi:MAG: hypothetical protein ABEJ75_03420 [Candidatus Nanohaloarchaea archaeon]
MNRDRVAAFFSTVLHPLAVPVPAGLIILALSGHPFPAALKWVSVTAAAVVLPLLLTVSYLERYRGLDTDERAPRNRLYLFGLLCMAGAIVLLEHLGGPAILLESMETGIIAGLAGAVVNLRTKISLHAGVIAGATSMIYSVEPVAGLATGIAAAAVGWSRIKLDHHTPVQVALGFLVPVLAAAIVFSTL